MGKFLFRLKMFMQNRYGADPLYYALMVLYLILLVLHIAFIRITIVGRILNLLSWAVLIFAFYRVFSRNFEARRRENDAFMRLWGRVSSGNIGHFTNAGNPFGGSGFGAVQSVPKDKKLVKCPKCKATLRVPRQKGKHNVRCPRCNNLFSIRILFGSKNK